LSGGRVDVDIPIKVIGMRPGEKLEEELREPDEEVLDTEHPSIDRLIPVTAPAAWFDKALGQLGDATRRGDAEKVRQILFLIADASSERVPSSNDDSATSGLEFGQDYGHEQDPKAHEGSHPSGVHGLHHRHGIAEFKTERAGT